MKTGYKVEHQQIHKNPDCICLYNLIVFNEVINAKTSYKTIGKSNNTVGAWKIKQLKTNN